MTPDLQSFDPDALSWQTIAGYPGVSYYILQADRDSRVIDMLFRFAPETRCFYHRHLHPTSTFVLQGEQHVYEPVDLSPGEDKRDGGHHHRVRRAGEFAASSGVETHIEGGGPEGCVLYMNVRAGADPVYSILNDDLSTRVDVTLDDFARSLDRQARAAAA